MPGVLQEGKGAKKHIDPKEGLCSPWNSRDPQDDHDKNYGVIGTGERWKDAVDAIDQGSVGQQKDSNLAVR